MDTTLANYAMTAASQVTFLGIATLFTIHLVNQVRQADKARAERRTRRR